jgi:hypothetical protein
LYSSVCIIAITISVTARASASEVWSFATQWSDTVNPNGIWSVEQVPDLTKEKASSEVTQSGGLIQQIIREAAVEKKK